MSKYTGEFCVYCEKEFVDSDDIVVCPECGAPHHRSCYKEQGHCSLQNEHDENFLWQPSTNGSDASTKVICPNCQTANFAQSVFCQKCNTKLNVDANHEHASQSPNFVPDFEQFNADGISSREISAFVGNNSFYFLKRFKRMIVSNSKISWNWSACIFKFLYFFYRKMYAAGTFVFLIGLISFVPSCIWYIEYLKMSSMELFGVQLQYNQQLMNSIGSMSSMFMGMNIGLSLACGLLFNNMYLQYAVKKIKSFKELRMKTSPPLDTNDYYRILFYLGRPSVGAVSFWILLYFTLASAITTYLSNLAGIF